MKVTVQRLPKSLLAMEIEPDAAIIEKELAKAAKRVANRVNIPGFRKGKAPRFMIENYYGKAIIQEEATDQIIEAAFKAALQQENVQPIAQASIENVLFEPFRFRVLVPLEPTVTLGDYRGIQVPLTQEPITDELVDHSLEMLREKHVALQALETERPAQEGDQLSVQIETLVEGQPLEEREEGQELEESTVVLEPKRVLPGLFEGLLGIMVGEEREISTTLADDHPNEKVAGKTVTFKIKVNDIQQRILPDWDELPTLQEFEGDLEALRSDSRKRMETNAADQASRELLNSYMEQLVAATEYDIPDALIEDRAEELLFQQVQEMARYGINLEQYLQITHQTHDEAIEALLEPAEKALKSSLALRKVVQAEQLALQPADIEAEITTLLNDYPAERHEFVRERLNTDLRSSMVASALDRKLRQRIVEIATGVAPEPPATTTALMPDPAPELANSTTELTPEPAPELAASSDEAVAAGDQA